MITALDLPDKFDFVKLDNFQFNKALDSVVNGTENLAFQAKAGCGKSLIIKILCAMKKNVAVVTPTGTAAMILSSEGVPAKTIHSFFSIPPVPIIPRENLYKKVFGTTKEVAKKCEILVIDEVSMMSAHLFDFLIAKLQYWRSGTLPRLILFGDVLQLPPVVEEHGVVRDFYNNVYGGKIMYFSSLAYQQLNFKQMFLSQSYRQADEQFAENIYNIGVGSFDQSTLDYFNQRVMPLAKYEQTHDKYIYMSPTNKVVDKVNSEYISNLKSDKEFEYVAEISGSFPKNLIDEHILIKKGAQIIATKNDYDEGYTNGMIGTAIDLDEDGVTMETDQGDIVHIGKSKFEIKEPYVNDAGEISYKTKGEAKQIDCKICKAITCHKSQGKTLSNAYLAPLGWTPPGIIYVGLSRLTNLEGLGLSRQLTHDDVKVFQEAMEFLTKDID